MYPCREFDNMYEKRGDTNARGKARRKSTAQEQEATAESMPDAE